MGAHLKAIKGLSQKIVGAGAPTAPMLSLDFGFYNSSAGFVNKNMLYPLYWEEHITPGTGRMGLED